MKDRVREDHVPQQELPLATEGESGVLPPPPRYSPARNLLRLVQRGLVTTAKEVAKTAAVVGSTALVFGLTTLALRYWAHFPEEEAVKYASPLLLIGPAIGWAYMYHRHGFLGLPPSRRNK